MHHLIKGSFLIAGDERISVYLLFKIFILYSTGGLIPPHKCIFALCYGLYFMGLTLEQQHDYAETKVSFYMVHGDHHQGLAVTLNLCLTNGNVVSKIWA